MCSYLQRDFCFFLSLKSGKQMFTLFLSKDGYCKIVQRDEPTRRREMKQVIVAVFIMVLAGSMSIVGPAWGQEKNLGINQQVTATIRAFDREFLQRFDVYSAGVEEAPSVLLFDIKDDYHLPSRFWGKPLTDEGVVYALHRLDDQYISRLWDIPFEPRALNVVNVKGEVLGYCYTGMTHVLMDRKKDGRVEIFLPTPNLYDGGWNERPAM
jgi:hypothetical protein